MNRVPHETTVPSNSRVESLLAGAYFHDAWAIAPADPNLDALGQFLRVAQRTPRWIDTLMHVRNRVGASAWGVQFHPEFSDAVMRDYAQCFAPSLQRAGVDADALRQRVQATPHAASLLARFAQMVVDRP